MDAGLSGRARSRLRKARENGFLDGRCRNSDDIVRAYGLWCWSLKIPMVRFERRSRYSKYGRLWLEMLTAADELSAAGQAETMALFERRGIAASSVEISSLEVCCDRVPLPEIETLARQVYRTATRYRNHEADRSEENRSKVRPIPPKSATRGLTLLRARSA